MTHRCFEPGDGLMRIPQVFVLLVCVTVARFRPQFLLPRYTMVTYNLSHLTQPESEAVCGPIQDTEALFLYALVRGMRMRRVLEVGGLSGYSAANFLAAFAVRGAVLYTVDINPLTPRAPNHRVITKNACDITAADVDNEPLDMVFFDVHDFDAQMELYRTLKRQSVIVDSTIIALHDTNTHPVRVVQHAFPVGENAWVHQTAERDMVNVLAAEGYHAFNFHTAASSHDETMPFRHGVTLMQKFSPLRTTPSPAQHVVQFHLN